MQIRIEDRSCPPIRIATEALSAAADYEKLGRIERLRPLTSRERAEQGIAAIKLIIFGSSLVGIALDRLSH